MPFTVSHFDLPGPRYAKAKMGIFGDCSNAVWPPTLERSKKIIKTFPPLELAGLVMGTKNYILSTLAKVMGVQSQKYQNIMQKYQISRQI